VVWSDNTEICSRQLNRFARGVGLRPETILTSGEAYLSVVPVCGQNMLNVLRPTAVLFIRIVSTVVEAITAPPYIETSAIVTSELPHTATCTHAVTKRHN